MSKGTSLNIRVHPADGWIVWGIPLPGEGFLISAKRIMVSMMMCSPFFGRVVRRYLCARIYFTRRKGLTNIFSPIWKKLISAGVCNCWVTVYMFVLLHGYFASGVVRYQRGMREKCF